MRSDYRLKREHCQMKLGYGLNKKYSLLKSSCRPKEKWCLMKSGYTKKEEHSLTKAWFELMNKSCWYSLVLRQKWSAIGSFFEERKELLHNKTKIAYRKKLLSNEIYLKLKKVFLNRSWL